MNNAIALSTDCATDLATENWDVKGKFPPALKPVLVRIALKAILLGEYNDNFFNLMPTLFPYNKFTMMVRHPARVSLPDADIVVETNQTDGMARPHDTACRATGSSPQGAEGACRRRVSQSERGVGEKASPHGNADT